ncbi:MAG TPA: hypothetical protein VGP07_14340 [Polyangia bacterium]
MSAYDITRFLRQPRKHYVGSRLQQGRLLLDSDYNEGAAAADDDRRRALLDLIGPRGTTDDGFSLGVPLPALPPLPTQTDPLRPGTPLPVEQIELGGALTPVRPVSLRAGSMYLAGERFELEQAEHFALQRDFLQMKPGDVPISDPHSPDIFNAFYYLHAWDQTVSAVEDQEIQEVALGGADTTVRVRRMRRVEALGGPQAVVDSCDDAFLALIASLEADGTATFDRSTGALVSNGRLQIGFSSTPEEVDCADCTPPATSRFLGADNSAIRVLLTSPTTFAWALDNGAPLYRVKVTGLTSTDPNTPIVVEMLTPPADETRWPLENRVVEIIPFSAVLDGDPPAGFEHPHFKKVAERVGAFSRVVTPFDPGTATFTIDPSAGVPDMQKFVHQWDTRHPALHSLDGGVSSDPDVQYYYMRLWHQATSAAGVELPTNQGGQFLDGTDLVAFFPTPGRRGDFWVVAERPGTPERVVPFDLAVAPGGVPPHGPRDLYAPLAILTGASDTVNVAADCRSRISRLTDRGCETLTVGDGLHSFGDFSSIQAAVDALPETGGRISIGRGTFSEQITIQNLQNVVLEGCGDTTVIESPPPVVTSPPTVPLPVIDIIASDGIVVTSLRIHAFEQRAVGISGQLIGGSDRGGVRVSSVSILAGLPGGAEPIAEVNDPTIPLIDIGGAATDVLLQELALEPVVRPAINAVGADRIQIQNVTIAGTSASRVAPVAPMISIGDSCDDVAIREVTVSAAGQVGVSVSGGSADVQLRRLTMVSSSHQVTAPNGRTTQSQTAIDIDGATRVRLEESWITMDASVSENAAVVLHGQEITVSRNHVEALANCFDSPLPRSPLECRDLRVLAWGGIQVRGGSTAVSIEENQILGGVGHGITLGSVIWNASDPSVPSRRQGAGNGQVSTRRDGKLAANGSLPQQFIDAAHNVFVAQDEGALEEIVIAGNRIEQMSGNGISVLSVLGMPDQDALVDVVNVRLERNTILGNLLAPAEDVPLRTDVVPVTGSLVGGGLPVAVLPFGGVVLAIAQGADIRDNVIVGNGTSGVLPTNGIFVLCGEDIRVAGNRISSNGGRAAFESPSSPSSGPQPGVRAGIAILLAGTRDAQTVRDIGVNLAASPVTPLDNSGLALAVIGNSVRHPEGRALHALCAGPAVINGNFFASDGNHGSDTFIDNFSVGDVVYVQNLGEPWEGAIVQSPAPTDVNFPQDALTYLDNAPLTNPFINVPDVGPAPIGRRFFVGLGGGIVFNGNQVVLDWEVLRVPTVGTGAPLAYFPAALLTLDHLTLSDNQFAFRLRGFKIPTSPPVTSPPIAGGGSPPLMVQPVLSQVFAVGATVNASSNRIAEPVTDATLSLITISHFLSLTTFNQTTHQILTSNLGVANGDDGASGFSVVPDAGTSPSSPPAVQMTLNQSELLRMDTNQVMFNTTTQVLNPPNHVGTANLNLLNMFVQRFLELLTRPQS